VIIQLVQSAALFLLLAPLISCQDAASGSSSGEGELTTPVQTPLVPPHGSASQGRAQPLPRMIDLGASECVPCRMMAPVLQELREEYEGLVSVEFIDVWENPDQADAHGVQIIPTQIFFDALGQEQSRNEGFMPREDIIAQFRAMGIPDPTERVEGWFMVEFFAWLTKAVSGTAAIALFAAFVWGVLSLVLSPCHLASIPLVVGFISQQGAETSPRRALALSTVFACGIFITIAAVGLITAAMGRMVGDVGRWATPFVAGIFFLVGLYLMGAIRLPDWGGGPKSTSLTGIPAALVLGLIFGVALGPCTFAYMAPILGVTFQVASTDLLYAVALLLTFAVGHCAVIALAGTSTGLVQRVLHWNEESRGGLIFRRICGALVIGGGVYLLATW
jgi:cytochrome c-type biogenesis protein